MRSALLGALLVSSAAWGQTPPHPPIPPPPTPLYYGAISYTAYGTDTCPKGEPIYAGKTYSVRTDEHSPGGGPGFAFPGCWTKEPNQPVASGYRLGESGLCVVCRIR